MVRRLRHSQVNATASIALLADQIARQCIQKGGAAAAGADQEHVAAGAD